MTLSVAIRGGRRDGRWVSTASQSARAWGEVAWPTSPTSVIDPAIERRLSANLAQARALGIEGTPALVVGAALIPGAVELADLRRAVAQARAGG